MVVLRPRGLFPTVFNISLVFIAQWLAEVVWLKVGDCAFSVQCTSQGKLLPKSFLDSNREQTSDIGANIILKPAAFVSLVSNCVAFLLSISKQKLSESIGLQWHISIFKCQLLSGYDFLFMIQTSP